jgi:Xaa-Pro aminopeptidase
MQNIRLRKIQNKIKSSEGDALLIVKPENRLYVSGFTGTSAFIVITPLESYLITDFRYVEQANKQAPEYTIVDYGSDFLACLKKCLTEHNVKSLLFEEDYITYAQFQSWQNSLQPIQLKPAKNIVENLRVVKDKDEIVLLHKATDIAEQSFRKVLNIIKPGIRENEVALELEYQMRRLGATGPSFETIVASGIRSSMPHGVASDKILQPGEFIIIDFGAVYGGYHSDLTRTIIIGKANTEQRKVYRAVLEAQCKALDAVKPGITCHDLDDIARKHLAKYGYDKFFGHSLGHGVGLAIHEKPKVSFGSEEILLTGMAITVEPGVYISQIGGVRIEDLVIVTDHGCINLTHLNKDLIELN